MSTQTVILAVGAVLGLGLGWVRGGNAVLSQGVRSKEERNQAVCFREYGVVQATKGSEQLAALDVLRKCQARNAVNWY